MSEGAAMSHNVDAKRAPAKAATPPKLSRDALAYAIEFAPIDLECVEHLQEEAECALWVLDCLTKGARAADLGGKATFAHGRNIHEIAIGPRFRLHVDAKTHEPLRLVPHQPFQRKSFCAGEKNQKRLTAQRTNEQLASLRTKLAAAPIDLSMLARLPALAERALELITRLEQGAHPTELRGKPLLEGWPSEPYSIAIGGKSFRLLVDRVTFKPICVLSHQAYNHGGI
ncbi:hypothetical protein [Paraburkholderia youngii]|uniref:ParE family toxin-like protein n=1 Tax=Paraburkholderia youngii TaxID=2782701 RepID=UPI003D227687